ncbi:hypothetical protein [Ralstonia phage vB_RsoP_BMB50]|uniref:Uncharacterized protein n=1 Tax=Ralstonia phage vB_RsoP_BMB50 TaxID=2834269 RepID=A0A8E5KHD2_9CAUD|nr:hypothetical protein [Ralstonia phage vB_RsoP_BMB50]
MIVTIRRVVERFNDSKIPLTTTLEVRLFGVLIFDYRTMAV